MYAENNNSAVCVNFLISVDSPRDAFDCQTYDFVFTLTPSARALPFEPFLSLLRLELQSHHHLLRRILANTSLTVRLQNCIFAWITQSDYPAIEPPIPVEFQFEQALIRSAFFEVIQRAFVRKKMHIRIENTQYLPASSSELVQEIKSQGSSWLTIDLSLNPSQINDWWPEDDIHRQLKHRFLTSGFDCQETTNPSNQFTIALDNTDIEQHCFWADHLYCGDELNQLISAQIFHADKHHQNVKGLCRSLRAAVYLFRQEDAHRIAARLESITATDNAGQDTAYVFESLYLAHVWFWHYQAATLVARQYRMWADSDGTAENRAYSHLLQINVHFLVGEFSYHPTDCKMLEAKLLGLKWHQLHGFLTSSYWFDHEHTLDASTQIIAAGKRTLQLAIADKNLAAESRSLHYLSIVYLHIGAIEKALHYINSSIEKSHGLSSRERTYNALNGRAYLLIQLAQFDSALTSVERAFAYVVNDGNYEQICTTMCNAALIALCSDHFGNAIKLVDDVFQIMLLRGLARTRFRSNVELKSIQAIAAFLKGDHRIAIAMYKTRKQDNNQTLEGKFFSALMHIAQQHYELPNPQTKANLERLFDSALHTYRHQFIALWVLRFQRELFKQAEPEFSAASDIRGLAYCEAFKLANCKRWFIDQTAPVNPLNERFLKLKAIKITRREAQIDLLKVENNLLKLALDLESHAQGCTNPIALYDFCLLQLDKMQSIQFAAIHIERCDREIYSSRVGSAGPETSLPAHHFQFQYPDGNAVLSIRFSASTEVFNDALTSWMGRLVDQLSNTSRHILDRTKSNDLAYIDFLTGLGNRAAFERFFEQSENLDCDEVTVALVDLDNFKVINDRHGHLLGDEILRAFAKHLQNSVRNTDHVYRMGGDEFFLVFRASTVADIKPIIATQLQSFFQRQRKTDEPYRQEWQQLGCSTGLLQINLSGDRRLNRDDVIQRADELMYRAKRRQRNGIETAIIST